MTAGVNQIESVTYFSSQYDESYQEALKGAVAMARSKAEAMAEASGKKLSSVVDIQEYGYNPQARYSPTMPQQPRWQWKKRLQLQTWR